MLGGTETKNYCKNYKVIVIIIIIINIIIINNIIMNIIITEIIKIIKTYLYLFFPAKKRK